MRPPRSSLLVAALALSPTLAAAAPPRIADADTRAWWAHTSHLASDAMEGRDTGSPGHARAARWTAERFRAAGLTPAGEGGGYLQAIPLHEVKVEPQGTRFGSTPDGGGARQAYAFLQEITVRPSATLPATLSGSLAFRGYCGKAEMGEVRGKVVVCFGGRRSGVPGGGERLQAAVAGGAAGLIAVDDPGFTVEPARWPEAYARSVTIREAGPTEGPPSVAPVAGAAAALPVIRISPDAFTRLLAPARRDATAILRDGAASRPLPGFDVPARFEAAFRTSQRDLVSENVLGLLPGTDPRLKREVVVVSAHLDGYGHGTPVGGDGLYNGAFDDAAYVATLIRLAESRAGRGFRRSVLFAAFTGEEKGLLGANWFVRHPTTPRADLVADLNLDQLRPLFPLKLMTVHALDQTTLGADARAVAASMNIEVQADPEPERNLNQRADHWPFLRAGVPATGFVFGYRNGTEDERRYREWYQVRYHRPQDDLGQPWVPTAARDFNRFFYKLTERVADAEAAPAFLPEGRKPAG